MGNESIEVILIESELLLLQDKLTIAQKERQQSHLAIRTLREEKTVLSERLKRTTEELAREKGAEKLIALKAK